MSYLVTSSLFSKLFLYHLIVVSYFPFQFDCCISSGRPLVQKQKKMDMASAPMRRDAYDTPRWGARLSETSFVLSATHSFQTPFSIHPNVHAAFPLPISPILKLPPPTKSMHCTGQEAAPMHSVVLPILSPCN